MTSFFYREVICVIFLLDPTYRSGFYLGVELGKIGQFEKVFCWLSGHIKPLLTLNSLNLSDRRMGREVKI